MGAIFALLLIGGFLVGLILPGVAGSHFRISYWIALPVGIAATLIGVPVVWFAILVVRQIVRVRRLTDERFVLASARKASGEEGEVVKFGPVTIWYSELANPAPRVMEEMEATRRRLESLLGRELISKSPPRILCFGEHHGFEAFLKCGSEAPSERRDRFHALLGDAQSRDQQEAVFQRHFGYGFGGLFDDWREWVKEQGFGTFSPPPPDILERLRTHFIPHIEDRHAKLMDKIIAIRTMGNEAYAAGADALIGLLRRDETIPKEELVWALEQISGTSYGEDHDRWDAWWSRLPAEIRDWRHCSEQGTEAEPVAPQRSSS